MKKILLILLLSSCAPGVNKQMSLERRKVYTEKAKEDQTIAIIFYGAFFLLIYGLNQKQWQ